MKKIFVCSIIILAFGCGKETARDKMGDAQICLDKAAQSSTSSSVDTCLAKIADVQTTSADNLRCSGAFVKEGFFNASKLIAAFSNASGGAASSAFLSSVVFSGGSTNGAALNSTNIATYYTTAKSTSTYCASAGLKVGTLITTFSFLGNLFIKLGCDAGATCGVGYLTSFSSGADAVSTAAYLAGPGNLTAITQLESDLGTLVINSYLISCIGTVPSQTLCDSVTTAVSQGGGVSSPTGVGKKFLGNLFGVTLP